MINAENLFFSKLEVHKRQLELEGLDLYGQGEVTGVDADRVVEGAAYQGQVCTALYSRALRVDPTVGVGWQSREEG